MIDLLEDIAVKSRVVSQPSSPYTRQEPTLLSTKQSEYLEKESVSIFSFFSGAGFLDLGFESVGYNVVYVNEIFKPFLEAYKYSRLQLKEQIHTPSTPKYGYDLKGIQSFSHLNNKEQLSKWVQKEREKGIVGFIGGAPCPDFSVAGKNEGQHGKHGNLSQLYADLICSQKPDFFVFENVKGLWTTKKHRLFFDSLIQQFEEHDYRCESRLINSLEYGAPQNRERIIIIGFNKHTIEHTSNKDFDWEGRLIYPNKKAFNFDWPTSKSLSTCLEKPQNIAEDLTVQYWFEKNNVNDHPNQYHQLKPRAGLIKFQTIDEGDDKRKSYKRLHRWKYSPTVAYGNNEVHIHPYLPRRISVAEALSLQSLPKEFQLPPTMTLTDMFKTIGNGVPYLAAQGIALSLKDYFDVKI
jgi:DNA (cytosine-5)-methyltransferase 1